MELLPSKLKPIYEGLKNFSSDDSVLSFFFSEDPKKLGLEESARIIEQLMKVVYAEIERKSVSAMQIN